MLLLFKLPLLLVVFMMIMKTNVLLKTIGKKGNMKMKSIMLTMVLLLLFNLS